jgi:hypothetical protein
MDDFVISNLHESRNEWCSRLVSVLSPMVMEGIKSIHQEAWNMCVSSNEKSKYLMTFQNLLSRIPKWNSTLIEEERKRIIEKSGCTYLEDLITCVHVIQLKILTCIRVGNKQKKIDISVPKLDSFLHRVYIMVARKCYSNVYLFERGVSDLNLQRNNRDFEVMVQECVLCAIRESIPTESIIRAYMDEAVEEEEEVIIEPIKEEDPAVGENDKKEDDQSKKDESEENSATKELPIEEIAPSIGVEDLSNETPITRLTFNDTDDVSDGTSLDAPKTIERLEEINEMRSNERNMDDDDDDDDGSLDSPSIKIHMNEDVKLNDVFNLDKPLEEDTNIVLDDIEEL